MLPLIYLTMNLVVDILGIFQPTLGFWFLISYCINCLIDSDIWNHAIHHFTKIASVPMMWDVSFESCCIKFLDIASTTKQMSYVQKRLIRGEVWHYHTQSNYYLCSNYWLNSLIESRNERSTFEGQNICNNKEAKDWARVGEVTSTDTWKEKEGMSP